MYHDPIVEEVREIRHKIEAQCHNDPEEYLRYLQQFQERFKDRLVRRKPQPALRRKSG